MPAFDCVTFENYHMKLKQFVRTWLLYFAVCAVGWCSLAGGGFILALAFMSDSSPSAVAYAKAVTKVMVVLFVYPLVAFAFIAGAFAAIHLLTAALISSLFKKTSCPASTDCATRPPHKPATKSMPASGRKRPFPALRVSGCVVFIVIGFGIIAGNVPRSLEEKGLILTVVTAAVFFSPFILLPSMVIVRLMAGRSSNVEQPHAADAGGPRR
jgi:4-amino-4-deoxy-L-arabinose transferase-like glycosyltransferase